MTLRRYKRIQNQKTLVKVYQSQVNDDEIWIVLADAIEINNEKLKTKRKQMTKQKPNWGRLRK